MAAWTNDQDIARDLNALSEFKRSSHDIQFKSYTSSWGRGKINVEESDMPETPETPISPKKCADEFQWPQEISIVKFPRSLSRGKKLEILQETLHNRGKAVEIREQVRAAGIPEYSNESIEATFCAKQQPVCVNGSAKFDEVQFEDSEHDSTPKGTESNNISLNATERFSRGTKADGPGNKKKKRRTYRNIALESLERINNSSEVVNDLAKVRQQFMDNSLQRPVDGSTVNNIPPACYVPFRKTCNSFEYLSCEFPKL